MNILDILVTSALLLGQDYSATIYNSLANGVGGAFKIKKPKLIPLMRMIKSNRGLYLVPLRIGYSFLQILNTCFSTLCHFAEAV